MHRNRTRLAARVNRIATALEHRGILATYELHNRVLSNRASRRRFAQQPPALDGVQQEIVTALRADGFTVVSFSDLFPDAARWAELEVEGGGFIAGTEEALAREKAGETVPELRRTSKDFVVRKNAYGVTLGLNDPWLRLATDRRLLGIANAYLGLWSKLEYVDLWYTAPRGGDAERRASQRWHRDFNDRHLLKVFIYLVDVDEGAGPFEYVPRSAPGGALGQLWPWRPMGQCYPPQADFGTRIAPEQIRTFTGQKGTMIFCNTSGFHRGGYATATPRVLATFTYCSPASLVSLTDRNFTFSPSEAVDAEALFALT